MCVHKCIYVCMHAHNSTCIQKSRLTGNIHSLGKYKLICSLSHVFCRFHQKLWKSSLHLLFTLLFAILGWETICYLSRHARCQNKNGTADFNITKKICKSWAQHSCPAIGWMNFGLCLQWRPSPTLTWWSGSIFDVSIVYMLLVMMLYNSCSICLILS